MAGRLFLFVTTTRALCTPRTRLLCFARLALESVTTSQCGAQLLALAFVSVAWLSFDRPSTGVSSHFVIDRDGNCNYIVREVDKAFTQAGFNGVSLATEYIATGREPTLFTPRGLKRAARIKSDSLARWNIPIRRGKVSGCRVIRSGMVDHYDLGACGGGHTDIRPFKVGQLIRAVREYRAGVKRLTGPPTAVDRVTCRKLRWWRDNGRPAGLARDRANRRKAALTKRNIRCTTRGPIRTA